MIYLERNEYEIQPAGGYDREGRWYPNHAEHRGCCDMVRKPSAKYWFSLKEHCRSAKHIGELLRLDSRDILKAASRFKEASAIEHSVILRATLLFLLNENLYATVKY